MKYAIVDNGRNQELLKVGDIVNVDFQELNSGDIYSWEKVLLLRDGDDLQIGEPYLEKVKVSGTIIGEVKGPKVYNFKKKRRKRYMRKVGHRQKYIGIKVEEIG